MATTKLTVKVDGNLCIGAAACVDAAPKFFHLDEDNVAFLKDPVSGEEKRAITFDVSEEEASLIRDAVGNCPTSAISIV